MGQRLVQIEDRVITVEELLKEYEKETAKDAFLPFEEKIKRLVQMQKNAKEISGDKNFTVWEIPEGDFE